MFLKIQHQPMCFPTASGMCFVGDPNASLMLFFGESSHRADSECLSTIFTSVIMLLLAQICTVKQTSDGLRFVSLLDVNAIILFLCLILKVPWHVDLLSVVPRGLFVWFKAGCTGQCEHDLAGIDTASTRGC